jgi:hypothetical protein
MSWHVTEKIPRPMRGNAYLIHCANQGTARATLLCIARELLVIAQRIDVTSGKKVAQRDIEMAGESWARYRSHRENKTQEALARSTGINGVLTHPIVVL